MSLRVRGAPLIHVNVDSITGSGLATAANQTSGAQKTQVVGGFNIPALADAYTVELASSATSVVYKFRQGGLSGSILSTVTMNYNSAQTLSNTGGTIA